jgi:DNA-binding SARP family transcriptional activator
LTASPYFEFPSRLMASEFAFAAGSDEPAMTALRKAMEIGARYGFTSAVIWFPEIMAQLCAKALAAGIEVDYVRQLIRLHRLTTDPAPIEIDAWPWPIKIYTLGQFNVLEDDQPLTFGHKVQRKPLALLKAIIAAGGKNVREEQLLDQLWPDADGDAARIALNSAIHRLRKLLGHEEAITREENQLGLDDKLCWVDAFAVERLLQDSNAPDAMQRIERALKLNNGPFLGGDTDFPSALPLADKLRRDLLRAITSAARQSEQSEAYEVALKFYEKGLTIDPCAEDLCRRVMTIYHTLGRPKEVQAAYEQLQKSLEHQLARKPSAESEGVMRRLMAAVN